MYLHTDCDLLDIMNPDLINFAFRLADAARCETLGRASGAIPVENKARGAAFDPVTEADRDAERAMRVLIDREFPHHGISGEELEEKAGHSNYRWSLDPIDGTRSYICGLPTWTTLIALLDNDRPLLGLIDAPSLDQRYFGWGGKSWMLCCGVRKQLQVSGCSKLAEARLSTTDPFLFDGDEAQSFHRLQRTVRTTRFGLDAYAYARLAAGTIDLVVECGLKPHDCHALVPVVRGAGGILGDWLGGTEIATGRIIAAATQQLYDATVEIMAVAD